MPLSDYLLGVLVFACTWGSAAAIATILLRRRLPELTGAYAALAWGLLFLGSLILIHLVPGMLTILNRGTVAATAVLALALSLRVRKAPKASSPEAYPASPWSDGPLSRWIAFAALALVGVNILAAFVQLTSQAPSHIDALSFGLPGVAHWLRAGSIWDTGAFLRLFQIRTYPNNGDVLTLATILPWRNDAFIRFPEPFLLALTGVGVYALAREIRAPLSAAALLAAMLFSVRALTAPALVDLKPDVFMYATFAAGCAFLLRSTRTRRRADLLLAGLGLGLAFGARWYGISSVVVVVAVWVSALLIARRPVREVATDTAVLVGVVLAAGGVWLVRNLALTGNPLYPIKIAPLGVTIFDAPRDIITEKIGFSIADRLGHPTVWRHYILPDYSHVIGVPGLILLGAVLLALVTGVVARRAEERSGRVVAVALAAVLLACAYAITPASAQGFAAAPLKGFVGANARWLVPAMLLAAPVAAWSIGRLGRARLLGELIVVLAVLAGLHQTFSQSPPRLVLAGLAAAAIGGLGWLAVSRRPAKLAAATVIGVVVLGVVVAGQGQQHRYNGRRFVALSPVVDWMSANASGGHRVGIAGGWPGSAFVPTYAMFGPRLHNDVAYVGPVRRGQIGEYRSASSFRRALDRGHFDMVVVGRLGTPNLDHPAPLKLARNPRLARWAEAAGFRRVAQDSSFVLLARGSLSARV